MLILPIKRKWFDMILSGEKKEEYRDIKPYYDTRLMDAFGMIWVGDELIRAPMPELQKNRVQLVAFRNGYGKDVPTIWTVTLIGELPKPGERFKATKEGNQIEIEMPMAINEDGFGTDTLTITDVLLIGTQGTVQRLLQDEQTGQIYPVNNVFVSIINNAMVEEDKGEYTVTEPLFNPFRGILWKNNVCKLRAHFRTDDKNIKVLKSLKGVDITPEVPEE